MTKVQKDSLDNNKNNKKNRLNHLFGEAPIWKTLIIMSFPGLITMLVMGSYIFIDSVFSIYFANDSYSGIHDVTHGLISPKDQVRLYMNASGPMNSLFIALTFLFSIGTLTRISVNLGAKRKERAINTMKTGFSISMILSLLSIPVFLFVAKPWMRIQYPNNIADIVANKGFDYAWVLIIYFPVQMLFQNLISLFRTKAWNKEMLISFVLPIGINLFLDWLLMDVANLNISGSAWATFISGVITCFLLFGFILHKKDSLINFKNFFGKFKIISIFGILLVGLSPFLRNIAQSIDQTAEMNVIKDVSIHIYGSHSVHNVFNKLSPQEQGQKISSQLIQMIFKDHKSDLFHNSINNVAIFSKDQINFLHNTPIPNLPGGSKTFADYVWNIVQDKEHFQKEDIMKIYQEFQIIDHNNPQLNLWSSLTKAATNAYASTYLTLALTGVFPIFMLFFPTIFGFAQGLRPVVSYNYGAKNFKRVRQSFWISLIYIFLTSIIIYLLSSYALPKFLLNILGVAKNTQILSTQILRIMMFSIVIFSFALSGIIIFSSTDRIIFSAISSSLRGIILFFPFLYIFKFIALAHPSHELLFWWFYPTIVAFTSIIIIITVIFSLKNLPNNHILLEDKIAHIYDFFNKRRAKRRAKRKAKNKI